MTKYQFVKVSFAPIYCLFKVIYNILYNFNTSTEFCTVYITKELVHTYFIIKKYANHHINIAVTDLQYSLEGLSLRAIKKYRPFFHRYIFFHYSSWP